MLTDGDVTDEAPARGTKISRDESGRLLVDYGEGPRAASLFVVLDEAGEVTYFDGDNPKLSFSYRKTTGAPVLNKVHRLVIALIEPSESDRERRIFPFATGDTAADMGPIGLLVQVEEARDALLVELAGGGLSDYPHNRATLKRYLHELHWARYTLGVLVEQQRHNANASQSGIIPARPPTFTERLELNLRGRR